MSDRRFSSAERFSIFSVHGPNCYLCREPQTFKAMVVDHIIPAYLAEKPDERSIATKKLGLDPSFDLESYSNLLPACGPCNTKKLQTVFQPAPIILIELQRAKEKAKAVERSISRMKSDAGLARSLAQIEDAIVSKSIDAVLLDPIFKLYEESKREQSTTSSDEKIVLPLAPNFAITLENNEIKLVNSTYGTGIQLPYNADSSFICPNCNQPGIWSGPRCMRCGDLVEDD